jgi:hypothetical protein
MQKLYFLILTATLACQTQAAQELCVDPRAPKEYVSENNLTLYMPQEDGTFIKLTRTSVKDAFSVSSEERNNRYRLGATLLGRGPRALRRHHFDLIAPAELIVQESKN